VQLRRDTAGPFTRLIVSQTELLDELRRELQDQQQALVRIQGGLADLAPRATKPETKPARVVEE